MVIKSKRGMSFSCPAEQRRVGTLNNDDLKYCFFVIHFQFLSQIFVFHHINIIFDMNMNKFFQKMFYQKII